MVLVGRHVTPSCSRDSDFRVLCRDINNTPPISTESILFLDLEKILDEW